MVERESESESRQVIALADGSVGHWVGVRADRSEVMWAHFFREQAHGRIPTVSSLTGLTARIAHDALWPGWRPSYAVREAADFAAGGVPTVSDEYGDPNNAPRHF